MSKRPSRSIGRVVSVAASVGAAASASAGGLYLPGSGPVSVARAGAAVASLSDPSALGVNPAGLAGTKGTAVYIGSSLVSFRLTFQRYGVHEDVPTRNDPWEGRPYAAVSDASKPKIGIGEFQAVPTLAVASDLSMLLPGLVVAAGIYAPTAYPSRSMGADYQLEDPMRPPTPTRYDTVEQTAAVVLPSIAVAYRPKAVPKLDVGARFSSGFGDIEATTYVWGLNNYEEWAGKDSRFHVKVKDTFVPAFGAGARYRISPAIEVGAAWSSQVDVQASGTGDAVAGSGNEIGGMVPVIIPVADDATLCGKGGEVGALKACVNIVLPMTATIGGRYIVRDDRDRPMADVELNVAYEEWSAASNQEVIVDGTTSLDGVNPALPLNRSFIKHNFQDVWSLRLGGSYERDLGPGRWTFRGGVAYDTKAAKEGWERADLDGAARITATAGASLTLDKVRIDVGGGFVHEGTRTQGVGCNPAQQGQGCDGGPQLPGPQRTGPDPIQPLAAAGSQQQSPFNEGAISSGYRLILVGVTTWF